jgi:hypothetical protein
LPKYCPNCGKKLIAENAKFCGECGFSLQATEVIEQPLVAEEERQEEEFKASIFELGNRLEEVVEKIYQARGFTTERRQRLEGKSGTRSEIDIVARKAGRVFAVECKNYSDRVGIEKVRDFAQKLQDLGSGWNGVFVSLNGFTDDAAQFAQHRRIETWGHDELSEKWLTISVGRLESRKGQSLMLEYALPLNVGYFQATQIDFRNKEKVNVSNAELIYHPYLAVDYSFKARFKDPTKKLHKVEDKDTLYVDALDGDVLNPMPAKGIGLLTKALKTWASRTARAEDQRTKKLLQELSNNAPQRQYSLDIENEYQVNKLKPAIAPGQAVKACIQYIVEKNTQEVKYYPKTDEDTYFQRGETVTYVPKKNDIIITRKDVVVVPKWSVEFDSLGINYVKEILACSGTTLEDTLSYCPRHFKLGAIEIAPKRSVAVCEVCGESLCENHIWRCPTCGKWLCEEHGIACSSCQTRFCKEHITKTCPICETAVCDACITVCPICNTQYGKNHSVVCDRCNSIVCPNCITTTGFLRKTRTCKKCTSGG